MTNVLKPVIPRQIADAIESLRSKGWTVEEFLHAAFYNGEDDVERMLYHYFRHNRGIFGAAVINGYEREKTAKELADEKRKQAYTDIAAYYRECQSYDEVHYKIHGGHETDVLGRMHTVKYVLNALGIEIKGVNV